MLIGIVGKPSCGKSTFFRAATLAEAAIANYPFTTIKPNHGVGYVRVDCVDKEFGRQCNPRFGYCLNHVRFVPIDLLDVAGLVPGAHQGLGRGNEFLDDLRQADVLVHVVDISGSVNENGEPVESLSYDPLKDVLFLEEELDMWYLGILKKGWEKFARQIQQENQQVHKAIAKQLSGLGVDEDMVKIVIEKQGLSSKKVTGWTEEELKKIAVILRKITKPTIIAANKIDIAGAEKSLERMKDQFSEYLIIPCSAESELALREAAKHSLIEYVSGMSEFSINEDKVNENQKKALEFIRTNVLQKHGTTGVQQVLDEAVFNFLKFIAVFPVANTKLEDKDGTVLPDCFLIKSDSTALDFAFKVHTDIGKTFVRAIDVKTKRTVGKEHLLKHRDVVEIITSK